MRALINAGKAWIIAYHECVAVAGALPGKERCTELDLGFQYAGPFSEDPSPKLGHIVKISGI